MGPSFRHRSDEPELMDDLSIQGPELERTLREIVFINRTLGGYGPSLEGLGRLRPAHAQRVTVLDVGAGSGDTARVMADWGRRRGLRIEVHGIDLAETTVALARQESADYDGLTFEVQDLFDMGDEPAFDVVHAAAVLHHFPGPLAARGLAKMYRLARWGVVINDFHRHPLAWGGILVLSRLLSGSRLVRYDAPLSVRRAFLRGELEAMCAQMALPKPRITWRPMFRWCMTVPRAPAAG